jgi:hypothetical protein
MPYLDPTCDSHPLALDHYSPCTTWMEPLTA